MSTATPQQKDLDHMIREHLPQAGWIVEGAFRFDQHLLTILSFLAQFFPQRQVTRALGAPPCAWSLDLYGRRKPMSISSCVNVMEAYAQINVGLILAFDNPLVSSPLYDDALGHRLIELLFQPQYNPTGRNAVCVASHGLAKTLRERYPHIPLICHQNHLIMGTAKRTPSLYEELGDMYREIILHPRDAIAPSFYTQLKNAWKYIALANDPVPRNYAARRELLQLVAETRLRPWDLELAEAKEKLAQRTNLFDVQSTCILSAEEEKGLYASGVRTFLIQSFMFRNELTLFWDMFYHLLRTQPEYSNEAALIVSAAIAYIRETVDELPTGTKLFNFADN